MRQCPRYRTQFFPGKRAASRDNIESRADAEPFLDRPTLRDAVGLERSSARSGPERVVWGSDSILFAQSHQVGKVAFARISEADKGAILGGNARRIFGLDTAEAGERAGRGATG